MAQDEILDYAYILFDNICDVVGPSDEWPLGILKIFWRPNSSHWERFILCTFVAVNGLNPEMFYEWVDLMSLARDSHSRSEFRSLLHSFISNPQKWNRAYAYHVLNHRFEFVNGEVKCYLGSDKKRPNW